MSGLVIHTEITTYVFSDMFIMCDMVLCTNTVLINKVAERFNVWHFWKAVKIWRD